MATATRTDIAAVAAYYRRLGWQPLPSDPDGKKPLVKFGEHWETPMQIDWTRYRSANIQLMCGRAWNLCVIDLDGKPAVQHFESTWERQLPRTWVSYHSDGGRRSRHYWFRLGERPNLNLPEVRKRLLWKGEGHHEAVELLCDRTLIMAPPSVHPTTGNTYQFVRGHSPRDLPRPAIVPGWVFRLPDVTPRTTPENSPRGEFLPRLEIEGIHDKRGIAQSWGLKFAKNACESQGWVSVHDFNREDRTPSARFHLGTGGFWRPGERCISFVSLGVALGAFQTRRECFDWLRQNFG